MDGKVFEYNQIDELSKITNDELKADEIKKLIELCQKAKENSYSPYSKFRVGCCILSKSGNYYLGLIKIINLGTNVENLSYGLTCCGERIAIFNAISNGEKSFKAIMTSTDMKEITTSCGGCRQVMKEFEIKYCLFVTNEGQIGFYTVDYLLPSAFVADHLKNKQKIYFL